MKSNLGEKWSIISNLGQQFPFIKRAIIVPAHVLAGLIKLDYSCCLVHLVARGVPNDNIEQKE